MYPLKILVRKLKKTQCGSNGMDEDVSKIYFFYKHVRPIVSPEIKVYLQMTAEKRNMQKNTEKIR